MAGPRALLAILLPPVLAAGCAAPGPYPSLAPRPAETVYASEDERQPTPQPDDPALAAEIARLAEAAKGGAAEGSRAEVEGRPWLLLGGAPPPGNTGLRRCRRGCAPPPMLLCPRLPRAHSSAG